MKFAKESFGLFWIPTQGRNEGLKIMSLFFLAFFSIQIGAESTLEQCPCDQIKAEKKCSNPDCISICGLQDFFDQLQGKTIEQCLEGGVVEKSFSMDEADMWEDGGPFLEKSKKEIDKIEKLNKKQVKANCPNCHLLPEITIHAEPFQEEKDCPSKYIKTHEYKTTKKLPVKTDCSMEHKNKMYEYFQNFVESVVEKNESEHAKKLWRACPDPCSFDMNYVIQVNEGICQGNLTLKVLCTHSYDTTWVGVPYYNLFVGYKADLQCKE